MVIRLDQMRKKALEKQGYKIVGEHSAVKLCHWMRQSLYYDRPCYKQTFYGIESHRCVQMTPAVDWCSENCTFCWRAQGWQGDKIPQEDEAADILEGSITAQRELLTGFKGDSRTDMKKWLDAQQPKHMAISLTGEPTLYGKLDDLLAEAKKRKISTFVVTNGTNPEALEKLTVLPTQLYVTVAAPNEKLFNEILNPIYKDGWERLNRTLEMLPSLDTRTVIRHTLVKNFNLGYVEEYYRLDRKADPDFIENKGYVHVGGSKNRLSITDMPSHEEIRDFSFRLNGYLNYDFGGERVDSRIVLLSKDRRKNMIDFSAL
jgi:tRNA wybutosine-synthesizing protein 1